MQLSRLHKALTATLSLAERTLNSKQQRGLPPSAIQHAEDSVAKMKRALVENEQQASWVQASGNEGSYTWKV